MELISLRDCVVARETLPFHLMLMQINVCLFWPRRVKVLSNFKLHPWEYLRAFIEFLLYTSLCDQHFIENAPKEKASWFSLGHNSFCDPIPETSFQVTLSHPAHVWWISQAQTSLTHISCSLRRRNGEASDGYWCWCVSSRAKGTRLTLSMVDMAFKAIPEQTERVHQRHRQCPVGLASFPPAWGLDLYPLQLCSACFLPVSSHGSPRPEEIDQTFEPDQQKADSGLFHFPVVPSWARRSALLTL